LTSRGGSGSYIFDSRIKVLGDLKELAGVLRLADFQCDKSIPVDHNASESDVKTQFFPRLLSLLSNQTMEELCNYIALDFYRFDYYKFLFFCPKKLRLAPIRIRAKVFTKPFHSKIVMVIDFRPPS
jgi:hypothetical protein